MIAGDEAAAPALADPARRDVAVRERAIPATEAALWALADAIRSDATFASASALPFRAGPAADVAAGAPATHRPRLIGPVSGLVLIRRAALDLIGEVPETGADLLSAATRAASAVGMQHVLVGEVRVAGDARLGDPDAGCGFQTPVEHAVLLSDQALRPLTVTVDLRCLTSPITGTQTHALEAAAALARRGDLRVRALLPGTVHPEARTALERLSGVELLDIGAVKAAVERGEKTEMNDVFHRSFQISDVVDLELAALLGRRLVVNHLDLIAYRAPGYHVQRSDWEAFRRVTRLALARADAVVFSSEHARADALADGLVEPHVAHVAPIAAEHPLLGDGPAPARPTGLPADGRPYLLVLGADFAHKQRPFALRVGRAMAQRGWPGRVVLAGPHVLAGGTAPDESALMGADAVDLGPVTEAEKAWLYEHAAAVAYPTTYEGFGMIPFEAARHGTPTLFAPLASLGEVLAGIDGALVPWDVEASAQRALDLLANPAAQVSAIRERSRSFSWDRHADGVADAFRTAVHAPARLAGRLAADALAIEAARGDWEGRYWHLRNQIGPAGLALVGPEGPLLDDRERRTLAGLVRRPVTGRPLRGILRLLGRG